MTFAQRRNCQKTHFSEGSPVVKRHVSVLVQAALTRVQNGSLFPRPVNSLQFVIRTNNKIFTCQSTSRGRFQWPCGLKRGSEAGRLLGLRVRIPAGAWMSVSFECCVLAWQKSLRQADYSSRGVLPSEVCLSEIVNYR